jgi:hypothetical protein
VDNLSRLETELKTLAREHHPDFFGESESCRVELPHGALLFALERRVKRARGVLENLKAEGFTQAVKIAESVDWDLLETWPEERLWLVGTERKTKEVYAYEVK